MGSTMIDEAYPKDCTVYESITVCVDNLKNKLTRTSRVKVFAYRNDLTNEPQVKWFHIKSEYQQFVKSIKLVVILFDKELYWI